MAAPSTAKARVKRPSIASEKAESAAAGARSPHLDPHEKQQAADQAALHPRVIHEVVREEGEQELKRSFSALAWSGLAAGMSMGFSLLGMAMLRADLSPGPGRHLIDSTGYSIGFIITILGRQQLFTESTLTGVLPLLMHRDKKTLLALLRNWGIVLGSNLLGTASFAFLISIPGLFSPAIEGAMNDIGLAVVDAAFLPHFIKAILAGWLIALMVWLLPNARSARFLVILLLTYVVALGAFPHTVAGSVEAAYVVMTGAVQWSHYFTGFLLPTLLGNTIGGVALVALLNYAPLADDFRGGAGERR